MLRQGNRAEDIEDILILVRFTSEEPPAYLIVKNLGLRYFEWLSADNIGDGEHYEN